MIGIEDRKASRLKDKVSEMLEEESVVGSHVRSMKTDKAT